jgi:hypothetical protein
MPFANHPAYQHSADLAFRTDTVIAQLAPQCMRNVIDERNIIIIVTMYHGAESGYRVFVHHATSGYASVAAMHKFERSVHARLA